MKKLFVILGIAAFAAGSAYPAFAGAQPAAGSSPDRIIFGQEDCKEGEKWNETTQKCEADGG